MIKYDETERLIFPICSFVPVNMILLAAKSNYLSENNLGDGVPKNYPEDSCIATYQIFVIFSHDKSRRSTCCRIDHFSE